jgi:hypothetical protein
VVFKGSVEKVHLVFCSSEFNASPKQGGNFTVEWLVGGVERSNGFEETASVANV